MSLTQVATGIIADGAITESKILDANITPAKLSQPFTSATAQNATGTSISWLSIPSWVKRITMILRGVSTNGTSNWLVRIGGGGSFLNGGYTSSSTYSSASSIASSSTAGFLLAYGSYSSAAATIDGHVVITQVEYNWWVASHCLGSNSNGASLFGGGAVDLGSEMPFDRVRLTTVNGTDTFDAGRVNIFYE